MKKITLFIMALFISISAASSVYAESSDSSINVAQLIASSESIDDVLTTLMKDGNMTLQEAVQAVINAGGDSITTLTAAVGINPDFELADNFDPNTQDATASGGGDDSNSGGADTPGAAPSSGGGGGGAVSA